MAEELKDKECGILTDPPRPQVPLFVSPHYYILEAVPLWRSFSCDIPSKSKVA